MIDVVHVMLCSQLQYHPELPQSYETHTAARGRATLCIADGHSLHC
jgi:hypothetical protein